jgi:hypothetical protein
MTMRCDCSLDGPDHYGSLHWTAESGYSYRISIRFQAAGFADYILQLG